MKRQQRSINRSRPQASRTHLRTRNGIVPVIRNGHITIVDNGDSAERSLLRGSEIQALQNDWRQAQRWQGVTRSYTAEKVLKLRGTMKIEHTIADQMSRKLWNLLKTESFVPALGALSGNQAVQMVEAGLKAIYSRARCTRTRACTRRTAYRWWCAGSTRHYNAPIKFSCSKGRPSSTCGRRSSRMPKPGLEGRLMPSN